MSFSNHKINDVSILKMLSENFFLTLYYFRLASGWCKKNFAANNS